MTSFSQHANCPSSSCSYNIIASSNHGTNVYTAAARADAIFTPHSISRDSSGDGGGDGARTYKRFANGAIEPSSMTAAAHLIYPPAMSAPPPNFGYLPSDQGLMGPRLFKKHKVLPHPSKQRGHSRIASFDVSSIPTQYDLVVDAAPAKYPARGASLSAIHHQSRRLQSGPGPALPPTPPTHSRTSSSSYSIRPSSPALLATPSQSLDKVQTQLDRPTTPLNQERSPPTPDVTPPQPPGRPKALRPVFGERTLSKTTTSDSRTASFRTAREEPWSSGEDDSKSTVRPNLPSARSSQNTVRKVSREKLEKLEPIGLGLGVGSQTEASLTPKTRGEFGKFDGEWASPSEVEQEWDDNLGRNVTVRRTQRAFATPETPKLSNSHHEVLEDRLVTPTDATKAVRSMKLTERGPKYAPEKQLREKLPTKPAPSSETSVTPDPRRLSGMSSKSTVSTVVEAILVDATTSPSRRQTLRHVRKLGTLRDSNSDLSPTSSAPSSSLRVDEVARRPRPTNRPSDRRQESYTSTTTFNSISSGKARRQVWKTGGIPVIVVPDRRSSVKSSQTPSLKSTSSRRTRRSLSLTSAPRTNGSIGNDGTSLGERSSMRGRAMSESDRSDQRTIDFPPAIPARSSSLSAPTSRNNSRAGSLTAESVRSRAALHQTQPQEVNAGPPSLHRSPSFEAGQEDVLNHKSNNHRLEVDHHGDPFFGKRLSAQNTPFSAASIDTNGTAPEVSQAMAVNIYPHQNSSVLMVDHSNRPSESSDIASNREGNLLSTPEKPRITTTSPGGDNPVTPPQPGYSLEDVDSPLRNPRAPPEPPAIKFIPATPSGLTPHQEKQEKLGNYFEEVEEEKPRRSTSIVWRAFSRRRHSGNYPPTTARPGFLTRTLSLSRNLRRASDPALERDKLPMETPYPTADDIPAEANKLHPFWRPAYADDDDDYVREMDDDERIFRYPPIDNRPRPPPARRSLSARMKRTFAILPIRDEDDFYPASDMDGPDRRTIKRTPSGNLRVMKRRGSLESLPQDTMTGRPATAPEGGMETGDGWGTRGANQDETPSPPRKRRFSISHTVEELQGLPRRLSERRREKRSQELRQMISGPREVRDGVGEVIRRGNYRDSQQQTNLSISHYR